MRQARLSRHLLLLSAALASPAFAQEAAPASQATVYQAAFFASSSPRNALDIARRVPGFALDLGNIDARGFAGAAGNVVLNGSRPTSKSETLEDTLARIPAKRVVRVEVGPGALYGSEYAGRNQVLNVILSSEAGLDGSVTVSAMRQWTGKITPNLEANALIRRGDSTINISAGTGRGGVSDDGTDTLTDATSGELREFREKLNLRDERIPFISGSWALERSSSESYRLNARFSREKFRFLQKNRVFPAGEPDRDDRQTQDLRIPNVEVGGDITQPFAGGAIKFVALATRRSIDNSEASLNRIDGNTVGGFEQFQDQERNETIGRLTWTRPALFGLEFEAGTEVVLNKFRSEAELFELGPDGERTRIDLPIDNATVREKRAEAYVRLGKQISPRLRVDAGLAFEYSRLTVSGDTEAERTLQFLKPNLAVDWKPGGGWHTQFSIRRTVAQLNFFDFISSADFSGQQVNGGNADLEPQRAWELRATVDRPILGDGLVRLETGYDRISLLQDRVLTADGFDAPGNIGTGTRAFARLSIDAPLGRLGLKGARLKLNGQLQRTRVEDPISGEKRSFSGFFPDWSIGGEFRHDIGKFSYGFEMDENKETTVFQVDEFDSFRLQPGFMKAFAEYRPSAKRTIRVDFTNLTDIAAIRTRLLFQPNRTDPVPDIKDVRDRNAHIFFNLSFKQSFGG